MQSVEQYDVVVLGAGISGLGAGYGLLKSGKTFAILEATNRAGGVIESQWIDGLMVEHGPNSMAMTPELEKILLELDLKDQILPALDESKVRQILWDDRLHTLYPSPKTLLTTRLLSFKGKTRILLEPFIKSKSATGESVLDFFTRRFGSEVAQRLAGAIVSGIYAGDAAQLEMAAVFPRFVELEKEYGSLLRGLKKAPGTSRSIISFENGMETFVKTLSRKLHSHLHFNKDVEQILKANDLWIITNADGSTIKANHVISTLPHYALSPVLKKNDFPRIEFDYNPMLTLQVQLPTSALKRSTKGFGFLASSYERNDFIGVMYNGNTFKHGINDGHALVNFFVRPDHCTQTEPQQIFSELCVPLFEKWTGIDIDLQLIHHKFWKQAIPQKQQGHLHFLESLKTWERQNSGFIVGGNYVTGVSVGDCFLEHQNLASQGVL